MFSNFTLKERKELLRDWLDTIPPAIDGVKTNKDFNKLIDIAVILMESYKRDIKEK